MSARRPRRASRLPRKLRFTREGRVFVLVTLGVGAAAVNTGNNLLYLVLGMLLSLIVLSGVLSEVVLRHVRVARRLPRRAFAGSPCLIELRLFNGKRWAPSYSVELEDTCEDAPEPTSARAYLLKVGPQQEQAASYRRTPSRRGWLRLTGVVVRTRFPFGLFEKWRTMPLEDALLVYPALAPDAARPRLAGARGLEVPQPRRGHGQEIAGLREYVPGDEARSIHWRRSASLGHTVVRERHREAARRVTLRVDEARPPDADDGWAEGFEAMLSRAAGAASSALRAGAAVEVLARSGRSPTVLPGQPTDPIWRFLALLEPVDPDTPFAEPPFAEPPFAEPPFAEPPFADARADGEVQRFSVSDPAARSPAARSPAARSPATRNPAA